MHDTLDRDLDLKFIALRTYMVNRILETSLCHSTESVRHPAFC